MKMGLQNRVCVMVFVLVNKYRLATLIFLGHCKPVLVAEVAEASGAVYA